MKDRYVSLTYGFELPDMSEKDFKALKLRIENNDITIKELVENFGVKQTHFEGVAF